MVCFFDFMNPGDLPGIFLYFYWHQNLLSDVHSWYAQGIPRVMVIFLS